MGSITVSNMDEPRRDIATEIKAFVYGELELEASKRGVRMKDRKGLRGV
jgi:hypothetical protein